MKNLIILACVLISTYIVYGRAIGSPSFEIRAGNCTQAADADLVWSINSHKSRIPFVAREGTERYSGNKKIYCILALSQKEESKGSTVEITNGGLNNVSVEFEMKSTVNHGYDYNLSVYAKQ